MLDAYLSRADVKNFISRIKNNSRYYSKEVSTNMNGFATKRDISLFTFYDALFKFKVIIVDVYLFDEYINVFFFIIFLHKLILLNYSIIETITKL